MSKRLNDIFEDLWRKIEKIKGEGYREGYREGLDEGYDEGHDEGHSNGYDKGYDKGYDDAVIVCESNIMTHVNAIELLAEKIKTSPWLMDKAIDIFDVSGYSFKQKQRLTG